MATQLINFLVMRALVIGAVAFCILDAPCLLATQRLALLIGNEKYSEAVGPLSNPHNDIKIVGASLTKLGFDVTFLPDANFEKMSKGIQAYAARVRAAGPGTISFVYYSGHGAADRSSGINYLIPVDVTSADDSSLWENSLDLKVDVVDKLSKQAPEATHFIVFDACRSELQLKINGRKAFDGKGFRPVEADGILIAFSTAPGRTASDVGEGGGPYARALAAELLIPGFEAVVMFRNVQVRVKDSIGQDPWLTFAGVPKIFLAGASRVDDRSGPGRNAASPTLERTLFERQRESSRSTMEALLQQVGDAGITAGGAFLKEEKWTQRSIKMCFLDGSPEVRSYVANIARQWALFGEVDFDFGDLNSPRMCLGDSDSSDVRITFNEDGNWAFVGMQNKTVKSGATMSLQSLAGATRLDLGSYNQDILHEFGHVLGFIHAWASPNSGCESEFDWPYIYDYFGKAPYYWTRETVDANLRAVAPANKIVEGSFDNRSVMNYQLPEKFFKRGRESKCYVPPLEGLSLRDKLAVYSIYK